MRWQKTPVLRIWVESMKQDEPAMRFEDARRQKSILSEISDKMSGASPYFNLFCSTGGML